MSMFIHRGRPRIAQPTAVTMLARRAAYHVLLRDSTAEAAIDDTFRVQRGELRSASQRMTGRSSPARSHESTEPATAPYFTDETVSSSYSELVGRERRCANALIMRRSYARRSSDRGWRRATRHAQEQLEEGTRGRFW